MSKLYIIGAQANKHRARRAPAMTYTNVSNILIVAFYSFPMTLITTPNPLLCRPRVAEALAEAQAATRWRCMNLDHLQNLVIHVVFGYLVVGPLRLTYDQKGPDRSVRYDLYTLSEFL